MASEREVKNRLRGVHKTRQITSAMKMVATIRLRHAQAALANARPYAEKMRELAAEIFSQVEDLLPVISFGSKKDGDTEKKHGEFVARMVGRGYTERQVRRLVEWYMRVKQAG